MAADILLYQTDTGISTSS
ncbi:hypothetical protein [Burkholderia cepacia]